MPNKITINKIILKKIGKKYQLRYLVLFGSRAELMEKKQSDYDIAYSSAMNIDYGEEIFLTEHLARAIKVNPEKIDLVNTKNAGPLLAKEIAVNGRLLAEFIPDSFDKFQIYALMSYFEAKPLFKMQEEYVNRNIK